MPGSSMKQLLRMPSRCCIINECHNALGNSAVWWIYTCIWFKLEYSFLRFYIKILRI